VFSLLTILPKQLPLLVGSVYQGNWIIGGNCLKALENTGSSNGICSYSRSVLAQGGPQPDSWTNFTSGKLP